MRRLLIAVALTAMLTTPVSGQWYFPTWLSHYYGLDSTPRLTIKPDPTPVIYHWHDPSQPIFLHHPNDPHNPDAVGLSWEVVEWNEDAENASGAN